MFSIPSALYDVRSRGSCFVGIPSFWMNLQLMTESVHLGSKSALTKKESPSWVVITVWGHNSCLEEQSWWQYLLTSGVDRLIVFGFIIADFMEFVDQIQVKVCCGWAIDPMTKRFKDRKSVGELSD